MKDYIYRGKKVPDQIIEELGRYLLQQTPPGAFLRAVLANQLQQAFHYGNDDVTDAMHAIVIFIYNEIPSKAWGNIEKIDAWLKAPMEEHTKRLPSIRVSPYFVEGET